uniref:Endonuclease/exonuclease/phosphatase domain-containing protein n=1 Tax=Mucochytrium quahogii TaxID=96639 RepID=A0A7S2WDB4_9STRA|mmetsp:Transcript_18786/g.30690  ORF Transcript_18786/g.30690 Transcript_18786/m.30690 type:complete len:289 (+) Transcript_18786:386-1252(+)
MSLMASREWCSVGQDGNEPAVKLSIMTWNMLADGLGLDSFANIQPEQLQWQARKDAVLGAIVHHEPDVVCLQEVNRFNDFLEPELKSRGYSGFFSEKAKSPCTKFGFPKDGCAIFTKDENVLVKSCECHAYESGGQIFQTCELGVKGFKIYLFNTHLKAKPDFEDLRVKQVSQLLEKVDKLRQEDETCNILFCGDLNTDPGGAVHKLVVSKGRFESAYMDLASEHFSTWKVRESEVKHCIDYIFYSGTNITLKERLSVPDESAVGAARLPSVNWPSDHISLHAVFSLK